MNVEVERKQTNLNYLCISQNSASMVRTCCVYTRYRRDASLNLDQKIERVLCLTNCGISLSNTLLIKSSLSYPVAPSVIFEFLGLEWPVFFYSFHIASIFTLLFYFEIHAV